MPRKIFIYDKDKAKVGAYLRALYLTTASAQGLRNEDEE